MSGRYTEYKIVNVSKGLQEAWLSWVNELNEVTIKHTEKPISFPAWMAEQLPQGDRELSSVLLAQERDQVHGAFKYIDLFSEDKSIKIELSWAVNKPENKIKANLNSYNDEDKAS